MIIFLLLQTCILAFKPTSENQFLLVSTSKFWFNLRQSVNSLMIYSILKDLGVKDENVNVVLLIPEESACNSKNNLPGMVCPFDDQMQPNVYRNVELDYKKNDVSIKTWIDLLRGKYNKYTCQSKRLRLNSEKRFLDYANGHGGDGYMKMQDTSYILDFEMEKVVKEMAFLRKQKHYSIQFSRYKEAFFIADSCSAVTLYSKVKTKDTLILGSSKFNQKSYSHGKDSKLLISKTDKFKIIINFFSRFSLWTFNFFNNKFKNNQLLTVYDYIQEFDPKVMNSDTELINNLSGNRTEKDIKMADFFKPNNPELVQQKRLITISKDNRQKWDFLQQFSYNTTISFNVMDINKKFQHKEISI